MSTPTIRRENTHIRVAQLNAQRSVMVLTELRKLAEDLKLDIICLQEPYSSKSKIPHMPITARVIKEGEAPMAATVILNKNIKVARVSQFCNSHINCTEVVTCLGGWILVNICTIWGSPGFEYCENNSKGLCQYPHDYYGGC